ncbi:MAG: CdvA-like protein [Thaumarchaeota archaeon]|nr:CdvA-like protein [Nitrososphaerota archaeon]
MKPDSITPLVGKPVKDLYGRNAGLAIGFSIDTSGEVKSIGVDEGKGKFAEYPSSRLLTDKDGFVVVPAWKIESEVLSREQEMVKKRLQALTDLRKEGEISKVTHDRMYQQYEEQFDKIQISFSEFGKKITQRVKELEQQEEVLEEFLVNIKVYSRSGEIDEAGYKAMMEMSNSMTARDAREKEELNRVLDSISELIGRDVMGPESAPVSIKATIKATGS